MVFGISSDHRLDMHLNNGTFNGHPIYIHYTSFVGHNEIMSQCCILARPNVSRRGANAKSGIYLTMAKDAMNNDKAFYSLFLGEEKYRQSASHCIVFTFNSPQYLPVQPVSEGSNVHEVIFPGNIPFRSINVLYDGRNPFL